jgi:hypothetical protein
VPEEPEEPDDNYDPVPAKCTGCKVPLLNGQGNQKEKEGKISRYCSKCWERRVEDIW